MSIKEMIREHPHVGADFNEELAEAIRLCMDCPDVCTTTWLIASRRAAGTVRAIEAQLRTCIAACEACAIECEKRDHPHCHRCATMCREWARDCEIALEGMIAAG